jgi:hypothetical protein
MFAVCKEIAESATPDDVSENKKKGRRLRLVEGRPYTPAEDLHLRLLVERMVQSGCSAEAIARAVRQAA